MKLVLDASAAIEIALQRGRAPALSDAVGQADLVLAPDLFVPEVVNTIWKYHHFERLALDVCDQAIDAALRLVDTIVSTRELHGEAFLLARSARRPVYDMFYLALARREDALFLTLDLSLRREAARQGVRVPS